MKTNFGLLFELPLKTGFTVQRVKADTTLDHINVLNFYAHKLFLVMFDHFDSLRPSHVGTGLPGFNQ